MWIRIRKKNLIRIWVAKRINIEQIWQTKMLKINCWGQGRTFFSTPSIFHTWHLPSLLPTVPYGIRSGLHWLVCWEEKHSKIISPLFWLTETMFSTSLSCRINSVTNVLCLWRRYMWYSTYGICWASHTNSGAQNWEACLPLEAILFNFTNYIGYFSFHMIHSFILLIRKIKEGESKLLSPKNSNAYQ
jgi:hypothetical protein